MLHAFSGSPDGAPPTTLIQGADGNFYGTTRGGGVTCDPSSCQYGTLFRITASGAVTILHSFAGGGDGSEPSDPIQSARTAALYGITTSGGGGREGGGVADCCGSGTLFQWTASGQYGNCSKKYF